MAQFLRPSSLVSSGGWSGTPNNINETTPSDSNYVEAFGPFDTDFVATLSSVTDPSVNTGHVVRWRAMASGSAAAESVNVIIKQGSTTIASSGNTGGDRTAFTNYSFNLSEAEAANITDYTALTVTLSPNIGGQGEWLRVSWLEMEVPDAGGGGGPITVNLGLVTETGLAQAVTKVDPIRVTLGLATETDTATVVQQGIVVDLGLATEYPQAPQTFYKKQSEFAFGLAETRYGGGAITVNLGLATETDTAQAFTKIDPIHVGLGQTTTTDTAQVVTPAITRRYFNLGLTTEADTAQAVGKSRTYAVGLTSTTDTAQSVTPTSDITVNIGLATEADTAQAIGKTDPIYVVLGLTTEADTAQSVTAQHVYSVGLTAESDAAQPVAVTKAYPLGLTSTTDTAQTITSQSATIVNLGLTAEADTAQPVTARHSYTVGQPATTDTAQPVTQINYVPVGQAVEWTQAPQVFRQKQSEFALPLAEIKYGSDIEVTLGLATEADAAQPVGKTDPIHVQVGQATETSTAFAVATGASYDVGQASTTDAAQAVDATKAYSIGTVAATEAAQAVQRAKAVGTGQASTTDAAQAVTVARPVAVGLTTEANTTQAVAHAKAQAVAQATETDTAQPVTSDTIVVRNLGLTAEADAAQGVTPTVTRRYYPMGLATEVDTALDAPSADRVELVAEANTAQLVARRKTYTLGAVTDTHAAQGVTVRKAAGVGLVTETSAAQGVTVRKVRTIGTTAEPAVAHAVTALRFRTLATAIELDETFTILRTAPNYYHPSGTTRPGTAVSAAASGGTAAARRAGSAGVRKPGSGATISGTSGGAELP